MKTLGYIIPAASEESIRLDRWKDVIAADPRLEPLDNLTGQNPFTKEPIEIPAPNSATVVAAGECIGRMIWAEDRITVSGQTRAVVSFARQIAEMLGADFHDDQPPDIGPSLYASSEERIAYLSKRRTRQS
jgi:hypothetical protein